MLRRILPALLALICLSGAAEAANWTVQTVEGSARKFGHGLWSDLKPGVELTANTTIEAADGPLRLAYGQDALTLQPQAKIRVEDLDGPVVRALEGALDVDIAPPDGLLVMTTYSAVEAADADFGVAVEPYGATISVRRGAVTVTNLATQVAVVVGAGQVLRVRGGEPNVARTSEATAPAPKEIELAKLVDPATLGKPDQKADAALVDQATDAIRDQKRKALGSGEKADPRATDEAVGAIIDQKRKTRMGKAGPHAVAAAARLTRELFQDVDYEPEPWEDNFEWTQVEGGVVRLKPISRIILGLSAPESYEFWFLGLVACLFLGAGASALMERAGFSAIQSALVVALAFAAGILIRDLFFRAGGNIAIEPYLSIGMLLTAATAALIGGGAAKLRIA